jgi:hypothetical protein
MRKLPGLIRDLARAVIDLACGATVIWLAGSIAAVPVTAQDLVLILGIGDVGVGLMRVVSAVRSRRSVPHRTGSRYPVEVRARHEAAHAVVAHVLGAKVKSISTVVLPGSGGRTNVSFPEGLPVDSEVAILLAGPIEDGGVSGIATDGSDDYSTATMTAVKAVVRGDDRSVSDILRSAERLAVGTLAEHHVTADRIATVLSTGEGTIAGEELAVLLKGCDA